MTVFGKRPSDLTREDIERLVTEGVQEGDQVEFKAALPAKGRSNDPWIEGRGYVGDRARNEIIEEVVAFANAHGGTLFLGVVETSEKPPRAESVSPLPHCAELAERLRLQCRDCIDPQIPLLEVASVPIGDDGSGVVILQMPRSRLAPHRHQITKECYVRRADRSEKMTMREIQDLTLQVERGIAMIETEFSARESSFIDRFDEFRRDSEHCFGLRATLIPLSPLYVERVHGNGAVTPPLRRFQAMFEGGGVYELAIPAYISNWRPIMRGSRGTSDPNDIEILLEVSCNGLIEYVALFRKMEHPLRLYAGWFMCLGANALCAAEKFRRSAGAPSVEYGAEIEIANFGDALPIGRYGSGSDYSRWLGPLGEGRTIFPRYSIGPTNEFQEMCRLIERDFWHAAGHDWDDRIAVDVSSALEELGLGAIA